MQNKFGDTALFFASTKNYLSIVEILLTAGDIEANIQNVYGGSVLMMACERGYTTLVNNIIFYVNLFSSHVNFFFFFILLMVG